MRLHTLSITAFGPFAGTVAVDFDTLNRAGLFLLSGATGSGKSSVLDAICFALYGEVPGDRNLAKRLRCDRAEPGLAPLVQLETTIGGRRLRLTRSPSWERPKRRGSGRTVEQARVTLTERVAGEWVPRSTRLDETGQLIAELLGMNLGQFCQVAMLPQGRFQEFLRARHDERHRVLQQLFRTHRFAQVEGHLAERRRELSRASQVSRDRVSVLLNRIAEAAGAPVAEALHDDSSPDPAVANDWATSVLAQARRESRRAVRHRRATEAALTDASTRLRQVREDAERHRRWRTATADLAALDAASADLTAARTALASAGRAAGLATLVEQRDRDAVILEQARAAFEARVPDRPGIDFDESRAHEELRGLSASLGELRALKPREFELRAVRAERAALDREHAERLLAHGGLGTRIAQGRDEIARLRPRIDTAEQLARQLPLLRTELTRITALAAADAKARALTEQLESATVDVEDRRALALNRKEIWLDLRETRLAGMAAEIAGSLAAGCGCPVCGSTDHPDPAVPTPSAPDAAAERAARRELDDAEVALHAAEDRQRELRARLAVLADELAGVDGADLAHRATLLDTELRRAQEAENRLPALTRDLEAAIAAADTATRELDRTAARLQAIALGADDLDRRIEQLRGELVPVYDRHRTEELDDALAQVHQSQQELTGALAAYDQLRLARQAHEQSRRSLHSAARHAGFTGLDEALTTMLTDEEQARLTKRLASADRRRAAAETTLAEPEIAAVGAAPVPDLDHAESDLVRARQIDGDARTAHDLCKATVSRVGDLIGQLATTMDAWLPQLAEHALVGALAALVEGTSPANAQHMRLSAYVLGYRLAQVVDAANHRLRTMSDQRYTLEQTDRKAAGQRRGGLGLLVRDEWSGESRDPATLSGGETFVVSLALALGLADVIGHEVGGTELDTLFVDEGFGALDSDTLDDVLDTLDNLREGGRVVGVVSHVAEMKERIPARIDLTKRRAGSTIAVVGESA
ncbi:MAG: AAA family ATPase [Nocardioides sp.]